MSKAFSNSNLSVTNPQRPEPAWRRWLPADGWQRTVAVIRLIGFAALLVWALATPGIMSRISLMSLLTSVSFIGCTAIGMTFITVTGNVMSLSLGATVSVCALVFLATLKLGVVGAALCAAAAGVLISGVQGILTGYLRANAILLSIAALALILGISDIVTGSERIYAAAAGGEILKGRVAGVPFEAVVFFACLVIAQIIFSFTRVGLRMFMIGSNQRAAEAVGLNNGFVVTVAFIFAGLFAAVSGVLLAARYGSADMDIGSGFDYGAIAAVLVGGNSIHGGAGSILQTGLGCIVIAVIQSVLLLRGFSEEMQYLVTGLVVLGIILLQSAGKGRRA